MPSSRTQLRLWLRKLAIYEQKLRVSAVKNRNIYIRIVADTYLKTQDVPAWVHDRYRLTVRDMLAAHYKLVIPEFGRLALSQIKSRRISQKQANSLFFSFMLEWISTESLAKATQIATTDYDDIRAIISKGIDEGLGTAEIARNIRNAKKFSRDRAKLIARTETHNAATFGSITSVREAENEFGVVLLKRWLPTLDSRTRPAHAAMNDSPAIPLDEKFNVGGEFMDRPGDPSASAQNVIACRCAIAYEEKET